MAGHRFTQCASVLFDSAPSPADVERALRDWTVVGPQQPAPGADGWLACGPGHVVSLRSGVSAIVDRVAQPWPDDARAARDVPALTAAWRAGWFGPTASPGALARARAQAWAWSEGAAAAERHAGFVRLRTVVELPDGPGRAPRVADAIYELTSLTDLAGSLLTLPGATALFFPGGEALRSRSQVEAALRAKSGLAPPPLELWLNLRAVGLGAEGGERWMASDVVGMGQLRLADSEAVYAEGQEDPGSVAQLLLQTCQTLASGRSIAEGSRVADARGRRWRASAAAGALPPARPVLRWLPEESARPAGELLARLGPPGRAAPG